MAEVPAEIDVGALDFTRKAIEVLQRDFMSANGVGPRRVAEFQAGEPDGAIQADVVGFVGGLLRRLGVSE